MERARRANESKRHSPFRKLIAASNCGDSPQGNTRHAERRRSQTGMTRFGLRIPPNSRIFSIENDLWTAKHLISLQNQTQLISGGNPLG